MTIHISFSNLFRYKGVTFSVTPYCGIEIFRRNGEAPRKYKQVSGRQWALVAKFYKLPKHEQDEYRL